MNTTTIENVQVNDLVQIVYVSLIPTEASRLSVIWAYHIVTNTQDQMDLTVSTLPIAKKNLDKVTSRITALLSKTKHRPNWTSFIQSLMEKSKTNHEKVNQSRTKSLCCPIGGCLDLISGNYELGTDNGWYLNGGLHHNTMITGAFKEDRDLLITAIQKACAGRVSFTHRTPTGGYNFNNVDEIMLHRAMSDRHAGIRPINSLLQQSKVPAPFINVFYLDEFETDDTVATAQRMHDRMQVGNYVVSCMETAKDKGHYNLISSSSVNPNLGGVQTEFLADVVYQVNSTSQLDDVEGCTVFSISKVRDKHNTLLNMGVNVVVSVHGAIEEGLTHLLHLSHDQYGVKLTEDGYHCDLIPGRYFNMNDVCKKMYYKNQPLFRALEICSELKQIKELGLDNTGGRSFTPAELFEAIENRGYSWDRILRGSRSWHSVNNSAHSLPTVSTLWLVMMARGDVYSPGLCV